MDHRLVHRRALITVAILALAVVAVAALLVGVVPGGWWRQLPGEVLARQAELHRTLSATLSALSREASVATAWTLVATSFLYGVFHAAGPGHGKVVLTAYLVSHERRIGPALLLSAASSLVQGLVAIVLVLGLVWIAGLAGREAQGTALWAERASYALVAGLGAWLVWRALRPGHHGHHHHHGHHDHPHDHGEGCGHAHVVTPQAAHAVHDLRTAAAVVLSVGLRPCSGAVVVLVVANLLQLAWAGVLAVMAMAVGTAITVGSLSLLAVYASDRATRLVALEGRSLAWAGRIVGALGGLVILAAGALLLWASFGPVHPLGFTRG